MDENYFVSQTGTEIAVASYSIMLPFTRLSLCLVRLVYYQRLYVTILKRIIYNSLFEFSALPFMQLAHYLHPNWLYYLQTAHCISSSGWLTFFHPSNVRNTNQASIVIFLHRNTIILKIINNYFNHLVAQLRHKLINTFVISSCIEIFYFDDIWYT